MSKKITQKRYVAIFVAAISVAMIGVFGLDDSYALSSTSGLAGAKITPADAATIGINYIGAVPSQLVTVDYDNDDGEYLYGVEIHKDGKEYDIKVNPQTGKVVKVEEGPIETVEDETNDETNDAKDETDNETDDDLEDYFISTNPNNTLGDAIQIAMNHVGTDLSSLVEADIDIESDSFIYSIDFIIGTEDISVEIDPQTGDILTVETELVGSPDTDND